MSDPSRTIVRSDVAPRLRAEFAERDLLVTDAAIVVAEPGKAVGFYAVPLDHVDRSVLRPAAPPDLELHPGAAEWWDLVSPTGGIRPLAAWTYGVAGLEGYLGVQFDAVDAWFEETERVHVHPRSSRHRVDAVRSDRRVVVRADDGTVLARTERPLLVAETGLPTRWYVPPQDVLDGAIVPVALRTACPYKGEAGYYAIPSDPDRPVAWTYADPIPAASALAGHVAFFGELVDIEVDASVLPRPRTQWSHGLRDNRAGGGSGALQATDSLSDHPDPARIPAEEIPVTVLDLDREGLLSRRHPVPLGELTYEPSERHVRGVIEGGDESSPDGTLDGVTVVVDSHAPVLLWEPGQAVPGYVFPRDHVHA